MKILRGPASKTARANYRTRLAETGDDAWWGRPEAKTADEVCRLLAVDPATLTTARQHGAEAELIAAQAFVVALDTVLDAGERGALLVRNLVVDALARRWSLAYRDAQERGATVSYDMTESTLQTTWRELLLAGVNFPKIWALLIRQTRPTRPSSKPPKTPRAEPHPQLARLYAVSVASSHEHARGRRVWLREDDVRLLDDVRVAILRDAQYRQRESLRLARVAAGRWPRFTAS